ncbi:MAG: c-type cytochrome [Rhizobiaceae bacterium]
MNRVFKLAIGALVLASGIAIAADGPIESRKILMQANGAAAGLAGGMMKGEIEYNPVLGKSAIATLRAVAHAHGGLYPADSLTGDTTASPKIAEDADGWNKAVAKYIADTNAAGQASGKNGPADLDAFKAAAGPVMANCKACHEAFRVKK